MYISYRVPHSANKGVFICCEVSASSQKKAGLKEMRKRKPKWKSDCVCSLMLTVPFMTGFFDGVPMKGKVIIECHSGCINKKLLDGKVGVVFAGKIEGKHADWQDGNWCKEKN